MKKFLASAFILCGLLSSSLDAYAQSSRHSNTSSLAQMGCINDEGRYYVENKDVLIGRQIYTGIARFGSAFSGGKNVSKDKPISMSCSLAPNGSNPSYQTLNLAFGIADNHDYAKETVLRLMVYKDGTFYDSFDIRRSDRLKAAIDVSSTRTITLELQCLKGNNRRYHRCSGLWFTEDLLAR